MPTFDRGPLPHIACTEPMVGGELLGCFFWHLPIARKHIGALYLHVANGALGHRVILVIHNTYIDPWQPASDRAGDAGPLSLMIGIRGEYETGRAHVGTPVTWPIRMLS